MLEAESEDGRTDTELNNPKSLKNIEIKHRIIEHIHTKFLVVFICNIKV
jgi:hypothetical protein